MKCFWLPRPWLKAWIEGQFDLAPIDPLTTAASMQNSSNNFTSAASNVARPILLLDNAEDVPSEFKQQKDSKTKASRQPIVIDNNDEETLSVSQEEERGEAMDVESKTTTTTMTLSKEDAEMKREAGAGIELVTASNSSGRPAADSCRQIDLTTNQNPSAQSAPSYGVDDDDAVVIVSSTYNNYNNYATNHSNNNANSKSAATSSPPLTPLIDNAPITCPHGKLSPKDLSLARRISPVCVVVMFYVLPTIIFSYILFLYTYYIQTYFVYFEALI
jgi:hypothetical protein